MTLLSQIHDIHMKVSYNHDHPIHKYIENELNSKGYGYDRKYIISINKHNQIDQSLSIIKGCLYTDPKKFIRLLEKHVDINIVKKYNINLPNHNNEIEQYMNIYQQKVNNSSKIQIIEWIINLYEGIRNQKNDKSNISYLIYFLGTIEWFHLAIVRLMLYKHNKNMIFVMGEYQDFDLLEDKYTYCDFLKFINSEYCSHSIVLTFTEKYLIPYDPDYDQSVNVSEYRHFDKICEVLGKKTMQVIPDQYVPIQDITDDHYCIFHCFWFIERIVQMNIVEKNFNKFMDYMKHINKMTKKADVHFFIDDLNIRAKILNDKR